MCTECLLSFKTGKTRGPALHKEAQPTSQKQEKTVCQSCHFSFLFCPCCQMFKLCKYFMSIYIHLSCRHFIETDNCFLSVHHDKNSLRSSTFGCSPLFSHLISSWFNFHLVSILWYLLPLISHSHPLTLHLHTVSGGWETTSRRLLNHAMKAGRGDLLP